MSDSPVDTAREDFFGFRVFADALAGLIDNEVTETPLTIAISAPWGGGKSSVANMIQARLNERTAARGNKRPVVTCWFDAWMHDDASHLGASLAAAAARSANAGCSLLSMIPDRRRREARWRK